MPQNSPPGSLAEFIEAVWWPRITQKSAGTQLKYQSVLDNHFPDWLMLAKVESLTLERLQPWISAVNVSAKTRKGVWGVMTAILGLAVKARRLTDDSYRYVEIAPVPTRKPVALTTEEAAKLLVAVKGHWMEGPVWVALHLGLRRGEMLGLKRPHVTLSKDYAEVSIQDNRGQFGDIPKLKNQGEGVGRTLRVPRSLGEKILSFAPAGSLYVFCGEQGRPLDDSAVTKNMAAWCVKAEIKVVAYKDLRSTFATTLRRNKVDIKDRMAVLGHHSEAAHEAYQLVEAVDVLSTITQAYGQVQQGKE